MMKTKISLFATKPHALSNLQPATEVDVVSRCGLALARQLILCVSILFFLLCCAVLLFPPSIAKAAPLVQATEATLTIVNESEATICSVLIAATTATEWGEDQLGDNLIEPGEIHSFILTVGNYHVLAADCNNNLLLDRRNLRLPIEYELRLTQDDINRLECDAHNRQGVQFYSGGHYTDAIESFQAASVCYGKIGDLSGKGTALNNIAVMYNIQERNDEALAMYEQALAIRREVGDRTGESETLNNIARIYTSRGRYNEALAMYEQVLMITREMDNRAEEGATLNYIGLVYGHQGRYDDALTMFHQALVIRREEGDRTGEGTTLNNIAAMYVEQARYEDALAIYQQALNIAQEEGDRAGEGTTLHNIAAVYDRQGRYSEALVIYQQAMAIQQEVGDRAAEGTTLNNIGLLYTNQGRYGEALAMHQQALSIRREAGDRVGEGSTLHNIGLVYVRQGRYDDALAKYQQALLIRREVGDRAGEGSTLHNIAAVYDRQGRYGEALDLYQQALAIRREVGDRAGEGETLNNTAVVYKGQAQFDDALAMLQQALTIRREVGDRVGEGSTLHNIGVVYAIRGQYDDALAMYQQALPIRREVGDRNGEAATLYTIGVVYADQGRYDDALAFYQEALAIQQDVGDRAEEGDTIHNIAALYDRQERYDEALAMYQQALVIQQEVGNRTEEAITMRNLAVVFDLQGRYDEALTMYKQALHVVESVRTIAGSETARISFIDQFTDVYDRVILLNLQQGQTSVAFETSERGRARAFLDSLGTDHVELFDSADANLLARENEAYAMRQSAQDALARVKALNPPDSEPVADLEEQLAASEAAYAAALAAIQDRQDQLADLVPGRNNSVLALAAAQQQLDVQTTLVSYWMLDDKTVAFILTADAFTAVELPDATTAQISATLQNLYQWRNRENAHPLPLRNLYHWLVEPLTEHLHTPHVAIVPHQLLHYVPFVALTDGQMYFGQKYTLSLLPSASVLPFLNDNARNGQFTGTPTAAVLGNPKTALAALPYAEAEAQAVAGLIRAAVYSGTQASELQLRTVVSGANILHLAAHGDYNVYDPLYSAIALAAGDDQDGLLETHEIFGLPLKGNSLVVLSACQTSLNELTETSTVAVSRGDEIVGLTRAFFFAGAPTVISSLWSVNDAATEALMVAFYKHWLKEGMSKAAALQAAQADVRSEPRWASPFYWAGFVLNGHPGEARAK